MYKPCNIHWLVRWRATRKWPGMYEHCDERERKKKERADEQKKICVSHNITNEAKRTNANTKEEKQNTHKRG